MKIYLGLGSNVGKRIENLQVAINLLDLRAGRVLAVSSVYETAPMYVEQQAPFLNLVALLDTNRDPEALLETVKEVEREVGRVPRQRYGPREIDIDLLAAADGTRLQTPNLTLPHPQLTERRFVLEPLAELAPDLEIEGKTVAEWLEEPSIRQQECRPTRMTLFVHQD